jgi:hypothetical protein
LNLSSEKPVSKFALQIQLVPLQHGALKLANAMSQNVLAERVTNLIEASMAAAEAKAAAADAYTYGGYGGAVNKLTQHSLRAPVFNP